MELVLDLPKRPLNDIASGRMLVVDTRGSVPAVQSVVHGLATTI